MTRAEWLTIVMEEGAEVGQAASKCARFGFGRSYPGYGVNHRVLAKEVGDLLGALDQLPIDWDAVAAARMTKRERVERANADLGPMSAGFET
jgi:hypothetical protein